MFREVFKCRYLGSIKIDGCEVLERYGIRDLDLEINYVDGFREYYFVLSFIYFFIIFTFCLFLKIFCENVNFILEELFLIFCYLIFSR